MEYRQASFFRRLWLMLCGWGCVGIFYSLTSSRDQSTAYMLRPTAIDRWFGFDTHAVWLYLSFFALVPFGYFLCSEQRAVWLARAMQLSALGAGVVFAMWPTTMIFPEITQTGFSASVAALLTRYDSVRNCFPSLHVTLTMLSVAALWDARKPLRNLFFSAWGVAVMVSVLQLQRHQFVDVLGGLALGVCAGFLAQVIMRGRRGHGAENVA